MPVEYDSWVLSAAAADGATMACTPAPMRRTPLRVSAAVRQAYGDARYGLQFRRRWLPVRVGERHRAMEHALRQVRATQGCLLTAFNPASRRLAPRQNAARNRRLRKVLAGQGWRWLRGVSDGEGWPPEPGFWVLQMSPAAGRVLGRRFGQAAVLWGGIGQAPKLIWC